MQSTVSEGLVIGFAAGRFCGVFFLTMEELSPRAARRQCMARCTIRSKRVIISLGSVRKLFPTDPPAMNDEIGARIKPSEG